MRVRASLRNLIRRVCTSESDIRVRHPSHPSQASESEKEDDVVWGRQRGKEDDVVWGRISREADEMVDLSGVPLEPAVAAVSLTVEAGLVDPHT